MNEFIKLKHKINVPASNPNTDRPTWHLRESLNKRVSFERFKISAINNQDYFLHIVVVLYIDCLELLGVTEPNKISRHIDHRYISINDIVKYLNQIGFSIEYQESLNGLANFKPDSILRTDDSWILKKWQAESSAFLLAIDFLRDGIEAFWVIFKEQKAL